MTDLRSGAEAPASYGQPGDRPVLVGALDPSHGRRRPGRWGLASWVPPLLVLALFLAGWYAFTYGVLDSDRRFLLPPPHAVAKVFADVDVRTQLFTALWLSTWIALVGLLVSIVLGMLLGIAMAQARWAERSFYPYAVILQCVPTLALVPLIGFWFEYGILSRLIICVMIALFPVISSTFFGLQSADRDQHDLFTLHRADRLTRLWKLQLPAALPAILTGFQVAATLAVVGSVVGDYFFRQGDQGIGILIDLYRARLDTDKLFAAALLASLLGVVVFWFFGFLYRRVVGGWYGTASYSAPS
jgi:NitT/TauT family transport system permease protein